MPVTLAHRLRLASEALVQRYRLVEIVRGGFGAGEGQRPDALGFDGDHIFLILQLAFDEQKRRSDDCTMILRE